MTFDMIEEGIPKRQKEDAMAHWIVANVCDSMFVLSAKRQTSGFIRAPSGAWIQARLMLIFYEGQWDFWDPFVQNQTLRSNKKQMASPRMLQTNTHHIYHPPYIFDFIILFTSQNTVYIQHHAHCPETGVLGQNDPFVKKKYNI